MSVDALGRFFSLTGLGAVGLEGWRGGLTAATGLRLAALGGECVFFWTPFRTVGAGIFGVAAAVTVCRLALAKRPARTKGRQDALELVELVAWLWVLAALR